MRPVLSDRSGGGRSDHHLGNGTGGVSNAADYFLKHLASWGFVIVATRDRFTGDGTTILDATNYMVGEKSNPQSIFFQKLDTNHIGGIGHSQGAGVSLAQ